MYEMFYRGYDPVLGRMLQVDPMASKYASLTPYNYSFNNPALFSDPMGDEGENVTEITIGKYVITINWEEVDAGGAFFEFSDGNIMGGGAIYGLSAFENELYLTYGDYYGHGPSETTINGVNGAFGIKVISDFRISQQQKRQQTQSDGLTQYDIPVWGKAARAGDAFNEGRYLDAAAWEVLGFADMLGIKALYEALATQASKLFITTAPKYLYHYTSTAAAQNISTTGLRTGKDGFIYLTNNANLSPLQAQIELALPANRALPTSILMIDASELTPTMIRNVQGNMAGMGAGGGTEFLFNQNIPSSLIKIIK
jgi:hypothetical protein